jgi:type II secretory ATPase GspE/PulE/Tfp pilus assembly ATPase PilB-like protein/RNA polymerase subunit RPABC4/transcription elongation factor Spt4
VNSGKTSPTQLAPIAGRGRVVSTSAGGASPHGVRSGQAGSEPSPNAEIVDTIIKGGARCGASDIHIEPTETGVVVRHRVDGLLRQIMDLPTWVHEGVVGRIKVMAGLDIAEKRLPQDGRIRASLDDGRDVDVRVSTLRTVFGEKVVLRILDRGRGVPSLETLGFSPAALAQVHAFLRYQHGMILVVGPTGSGKTTTLSAALAALRTGSTNIVTIEDPVEYQIPGVNQTQVNGKIDLTFARSLRAILRQDPDVVLVGEIRDPETARVAMQAAQTGHLVLSTLHTDDVLSSVVRLGDLGIEPYVSASALVGVIAQRLVRRLCADCRRPCRPDRETLRVMGVGDAQAEAVAFYSAGGCARCGGTGYRGRIGIYEVLPMTPEVRRLIARKESGESLVAAARSAGMRSFGEDGVAKVTAGVTSAEELLRVVTEVCAPGPACVQCGGAIERDFVVCPGCGHRVGAGCTQCGRLLQHGWSYCPYCTTAVGGSVARQESRALASRLRAIG